MRIEHEPNVSMQEGYEFVTALLAESPKGFSKDRAILISQDDMKFYISKTQCPDEYKEYLKGNKRFIKKGEFLKIHRHGPWEVRDPSDMEEFARIVLAIVLQASEEEG